LREVVRLIRVSEEVERYIVGLVRATRARPDVELGASPRAAVALYRVAQAAAMLAGRAFVMPDDVKSVAGAVLEHRLVVDLDRSLHGLTAGNIVEQVLAEVAAPPYSEG
jgi:MoxR-like ATPase